jgi:hypothetical protein
MTADELRALSAARRQQGGTDGPAPATSTGMPQPGEAPVTADDLRRIAQERRTQQQTEQEAQPGLLQRAGQMVTGAARSVRDAYVGPQDPNEAETQAFNPMLNLPGDISSRIQRGQTVTYDDAAYADVVRNALGNRFISMDKDANGYPIVTYIGGDGQQRREYVNKPGFDAEDFNRGMNASVPFMFGAGLANWGLKGLGATGLLARVPAQAAAAGATSIIADQVAGQMGSEQGTDLTRATVAAGTAGLFEGLSGPVAALWSRLFQKNPIDPQTGRLKPDAAEEARSMGLNPDMMDERLVRQYAEDVGVAVSPDEVAAKFQAGSFDIPTTAGQRTKDLDQLRVEMDMRKSLMGRDAYHIMDDFDKQQTAKIGEAVNTIGEQVGQRPGAGRIATRDLGEGIQDGTQRARDTLRQQESAQWEALEPMFPQEGAFGSMPGILRSRLDRAEVPDIDPEITPFAHRMLQRLESYAKREVNQPQYDILPSETQIKDIDQFRRQLLRLSNSTGTPADAKASRAVYDAYNEWIDEAAERALLTGAPDTANRLRAVRGFTREVRELLQPTDRQGKLTPAARTLSRVLDREDSGEGVIRALFGSSVVSAPSTGSVNALKHMREMLHRTGNMQAWDDVRMAFWQQLAHNSSGKVHSPGRLGTSINRAFEQNRTVVDLLYSPVEQRLMRDLGKVMDDVITVPLNPSGTSYELRAAMRGSSEPAAKVFLQAQSKRELFSKGNVLMSRLYSILAKRIPNVAGVRDSMGRGIAERAISQDVRRRVPQAPMLAPMGAAGVSIADDD